MLTLSILLATLHAQSPVRPEPPTTTAAERSQSSAVAETVPSASVEAPLPSEPEKAAGPTLVELTEQHQKSTTNYSSLRQQQKWKVRAAAIWTGVGGAVIGVPLFLVAADSFFATRGLLGFPASMTFAEAFSRKLGGIFPLPAVILGVGMPAIVVGCIFAIQGSALNAEIEAARIRLMDSENTLMRARRQVLPASATMPEAPTTLTWSGTF